MRRSFTPTLSELQAFGACARSGSVTDGARQLGLTRESAVSRSLASLEARLGVDLFHRVRTLGDPLAASERRQVAGRPDLHPLVPCRRLGAAA